MATKTTTKKTTRKTGTKRKATTRKGTTKRTSGGKALIVVESPTKATTIGRYLGSAYTVKATVGHVRDLPQRELGVDVDQGFKPKYVTIRGKAKTLSEIKRAAKSASAIFLATDPDREGEAIAWHVAEQIGDGDKVRRILLHEITKDAVSEALGAPGQIDARKVDAQQARRILDRLVGYKASPLLWKSVKTGLSAGRVQTVALRLIVEREEAIRKFVPQEYWSIEADLEHAAQTFVAKLHKVDGHKPTLGSETDAHAVVDAVRGEPFVVSEVAERKRRKNPSPPFTTSTLQQEAAKKLGFSASRTMRVAQSLYEGVDVGTDGAVGLITYMRTDSVRTAPQALDAVREFIAGTYGNGYVPERPNAYSSRRGARVQDAHEAIRPTDVQRRPEVVKARLESDQFKLYQLIWQRFVASQMRPALLKVTSADFLVADRYLFRAAGTIVTFDGYQKLYHEARERGDRPGLEEEPPIPQLTAGDRVTVRAVTPNQHFTEPPPRFSEAALVKELERLGIGRPSTYASIIGTLRQRHYVTITDRRFSPTKLGETVGALMVRVFPDIFNVEFTSRMEEELDKVEDGDLGWRDVLTDFWAPFNDALSQVDTEALIREAHDLEGLEKERCPNDGAALTVRSGRFGPFIACVNYPECRYTKPLKRDRPPDRPTDEVCSECGSPMVIKTGRYGEFLACTAYPKCKHTRPVPLGVKCPKCHTGDLAARRTKRGRTFYGCSRYPDCDFSTWHRPTPVVCPSCGFNGAESRSTKTRGDYFRCLRCQHEFVAEDGAAEPEPALS
jgi:DNA topoisomerase-1